MNLNRDEVFGHDIIGDEAATPWLKKNPCEMSMVLANASDTTGPDTRDRHQKPAPHHREHFQNRLVQRRRIPRTVYARVSSDLMTSWRSISHAVGQLADTLLEFDNVSVPQPKIAQQFVNVVIQWRSPFVAAACASSAGLAASGSSAFRHAQDDTG
ncbi:MAG: hypothetical protein E5Y29_02100 [Mesorhizobium sp.]|nr:MAG: hypothetical protein E5Y29_02100 [Mesorhizobium sp.]